jgi:hypothetical protein
VPLDAAAGAGTISEESWTVHVVVSGVCSQGGAQFPAAKPREHS